MTNSPLPERSISIDEEGFAVSGETRWTDENVGREVLANLELAATGAMVSRAGGVPVLVEAFDAPLVAAQTERREDRLFILCRYGFKAEVDLNSLNIDEWDRFHGLTKQNVPFVMSRSCQAAFFDELDEFDDDGIVLDGRRIPTPPKFQQTAEISKPSFWTDIYRNEQPRWDLAEPAEALKDMLPRLKLSKSRILVPGCGEGHDAAYFAREGHVVTAFDFSEEAIARAQANYGDIPGLKFVQADAFDDHAFPPAAFDLIFEHACFCAIPPERRNELIKRWLRWLAPGGHLMAVFFVMEKREGPPFGASEWELRERLRKNFRFLFWGRWAKSLPRRQGRELFVYAQKQDRS